MSKTSWSVLGRLRTAVKKLKFLLNLNLNRWRIASMLGASASNRRLSCKDRPGLRACADDTEVDYESPDSFKGSLHRTISYPSEDDIDKRAEMFIANFHKQLQIERQISLELRYCKGNSFKDSMPP